MKKNTFDNITLRLWEIFQRSIKHCCLAQLCLRRLKHYQRSVFLCSLLVSFPTLLFSPLSHVKICGWWYSNILIFKVTFCVYSKIILASFFFINIFLWVQLLKEFFFFEVHQSSVEFQEYLTKPVQVKVGKVSSPTTNVSQTLVKVSESEKVHIIN